jgi:hypothetical protein
MKVPIFIFFLFMIFIVSFAYAEITTFKSALVWRSDDKGDYLLPKEIKERYEIARGIQTEGQIQSISANWRFKGQVRLEVSADNGKHFYPIVNGVPLKSGFTIGNQLKWRAQLEADSELIEVKLAYTDTSGVIGTFGEPQLSGFRYRKALPIYQQGVGGGQDLFNYQMKIRVAESAGASVFDIHCNGNMQADFKDIRFTAADGQTLLPHYLERITGRKPKRVATFWVKIPHIPAQGIIIYLYYGNSQAQDLSQGEKVFDFFEDFDAPDLNAEKWAQLSELDGYYTIEKSWLKLDSAELISANYQVANGIIEYRAQGAAVQMIIRAQEGPTVAQERVQIAYSSGYQGAEHCIAIGNIVQVNEARPIVEKHKYNYRVILEGEKLTFERYGQDFVKKQAVISFQDKAGLLRGYIGLKSTPGMVSYYDWLRVRQYVPLEPKVGLQLFPEEKAELPIFIDSTIAENGNLVSAFADIEGAYMTEEIVSPFLTRIILPSWKQPQKQKSVVVVDISADGGENFSTNCVSGSYYYASKKDFTAGNRLRALLRLKEPANIEQLRLDYRPGNIMVVSPNGGELWKAGTRQKILWFATEYEPSYMFRLEYSLDGGKSYHTIKEKRENLGMYFWQIPQISSKRVLLKVSDALDENIFDTSDAMLEIK